MVSLKPSIGVIVIVIEVELPAVTVTVLGEGEIVTGLRNAPTGFTEATKHTNTSPATNRKRLLNRTPNQLSPRWNSNIRFVKKNKLISKRADL
jgi:hypothetical protein